MLYSIFSFNRKTGETAPSIGNIKDFGDAIEFCDFLNARKGRPRNFAFYVVQHE